MGNNPSKETVVKNNKTATTTKGGKTVTTTKGGKTTTTPKGGKTVTTPKGGKTGTTTPKTGTTTPTPKFTYGNQVSKQDSAYLSNQLKFTGASKSPLSRIESANVGTGKGLERYTVYQAKDPKTGKTIQVEGANWKAMQKKYNIPASQWKSTQKERTYSRPSNQ